MSEILARIRKGTLVFASGTLVSRISGFMRDVCTAALLGATKELALFFVAFRLANVFRRLLAETPLSSSVLPYAEKHEDKQKLFFQLTGIAFLGITLCILPSSLGLLFFQKYIRGDWADIITLSVVMFPSLLFLVGTGINNVFLQLKRCLFPMSSSSTFCNLVWIATLPLAAISQKPALVLSVGVVVGFVFQYFFTLYWVFRAYSFSFTQKEYGPVAEIRPLLKPFLLSVSGIAATQINNALDPIFARVALPEAPAYLWYAIRLYLLPLSLIGVAFFSSSFPELSTLYNEKKYDEFERVVKKGLSYLIWFFLPLSFLMIFCAEDLITLVYYRGVFSLEDLSYTAGCFRAYTIGLTASSLVLFLSNISYARGNYRWPAIAAGLSVGLNVVLNMLFVSYFHLGAASVAFATSLAALFNMLLLLERKYFVLFLFPSFASIAGFFIIQNVPEALPGEYIEALLHGSSSLLLFSLVYGLLFLGKKKAESR